MLLVKETTQKPRVTQHDASTIMWVMDSVGFLPHVELCAKDKKLHFGFLRQENLIPEKFVKIIVKFGLNHCRSL